MGSGISNHSEILDIILNTIDEIKDDIFEMDVSACKISILFDKIIDTKYLNEMHNSLLKKEYI